MTVCIVHDSELGNGERLSNAIRDRLQAAGHTVTVGHERTLSASHAIASSPDLLIVGSAVRKFFLSPVTKRWVDDLRRELSSLPREKHPRAAVFITHGLKTSTTDRKGQRLLKRLRGAVGADQVYPTWISARVSGAEGPFHDGVESAVMKEIDAVMEWAAGRQGG